MLHLRRPQSSVIAASIATSFIVVLLAVGGTATRPPPKEPLKCFEDDLSRDAVVCSPGELCLWRSLSSKRGESVQRFCAPYDVCAEEIAHEHADRHACCSTDRCNEDYDTAMASVWTPQQSTTAAPATTTKTTQTTSTPTTTAPGTTSTSFATTAMPVKTIVGQHPTTTEAATESTISTALTLPSSTTGTDEGTTTSQRSTTITDHASAASQVTPGKLTSISISAGYSSSGPTPNTSSSAVSIDNVTRIDVSTESGWTKGPLETTPTTADADKTNAYTGSDRTSSASIADKTASTKGTPSTSFTTSEEQSAASLSASTPTADSRVPYEWIALLGVGVIGALICGVLTLLAFLGIICAPKQSPGSNIVSKELDKTLL